MEIHTKKANSYIMKQVLKVKPGASGKTTYDQAYDILMENWNLEGDLVTSKEGTVFKVWKDDEVCETITWSQVDTYDDKTGEWDWNTIYKDVLQTIIQKKLYKRGKAKRNKKVEPIDVAEQIPEQITMSLADARKRRDNLSVKIWDWKKKGKDVSELEKEIEEIKNFIKSAK